MRLNRVRFFRVMLTVSLDRNAIIKAKSAGKQGSPGHKSSFRTLRIYAYRNSVLISLDVTKPRDSFVES